MSKLIIMQGLPGSGKSTKAKQLFKANTVVRLNRDLLREMLHFGFWSRRLEKQTKKAEQMLATMFLQEGIDVIIDDTNLSEKAVKAWEGLASELGAESTINWINTPIDECIERDKIRGEEGGRCVGEKVIRRMANEMRIMRVR